MSPVTASRVKPARWGWHPELVAEEWRWALRNCVGIWPLWEGSGDPFNILNQTQYARDANIDWQSGQYGFELSFDSSDESGAGLSSTSPGSEFAFSTSDSLSFAIMFWTNHDYLGFDGHYFNWGTSGFSDGFGGHTVNAAGGDPFGVFTMGANTNTEASNNGTFVTDGNIYFVVATWDQPAAVVRVYVNGVLDYEVTGYSDTSSADPAEVYIARNEGGGENLADGALLYAQAWKRELSSDEVAHLSQDPFGPIRPRL